MGRYLDRAGMELEKTTDRLGGPQIKAASLLHGTLPCQRAGAAKHKGRPEAALVVERGGAGQA
ncbi:hypothetical protein BWR15_02845 [Pseudomonas sp. T]|nr:hypothetical protein BWR15_02845 [Pseudomonas sp. T]